MAKIVDGVQANGEAIAGDRYVYWADGRQVRRTSLAGGRPVEQLCAFDARFLGLDAWAFYGEDHSRSSAPDDDSGADHMLIRVDRRTCERRVLASDLLSIGWFAVEDPYLFWGEWSAFGESILSRMPTIGGVTEELVRSWLDEEGVSPLAVDGSFIYVAIGGGLARLSVDGGPAETLATGVNIDHFAIDAEALYWTGRRQGLDGRLGDHRLFRLARTVGARPVELATERSAPDIWSIPVAVGPDRLYWISFDSRAVMSMAKSGGQPTVLASLGDDDGLHDTSHMAVIDGALLWGPAPHARYPHELTVYRLDLP